MCTEIRDVASLMAAAAQKRQKYVFFWGHQPAAEGVGKSCFSQWYETPFEVDGVHYRTAEHFMMAEKARLFDDEDARQRILAAKSPAEAKQLGRQVAGFDDSRWSAARLHIVVRGNAAKFSQNPDLCEFLLGTGDRVLVEASPVDRIWGIGLAEDHPDAANPARWKGQNLLGFALMEVRLVLGAEGG